MTPANKGDVMLVKRIDAMDALVSLQKEVADIIGKTGLSMVSKNTSILHDYIENSYACKQPPLTTTANQMSVISGLDGMNETIS